MNTFRDSLKAQAARNPLAALVVAVVVLGAAQKMLENGPVLRIVVNAPVKKT